MSKAILNGDMPPTGNTLLSWFAEPNDDDAGSVVYDRLCEKFDAPNPCDG